MSSALLCGTCSAPPALRIFAHSRACLRIQQKNGFPSESSKRWGWRVSKEDPHRSTRQHTTSALRSSASQPQRTPTTTVRHTVSIMTVFDPPSNHNWLRPGTSNHHRQQQPTLLTRLSRACGRNTSPPAADSVIDKIPWWLWLLCSFYF